MAIYLVQHGKNLPSTNDPDKGLSTEGKQETERIAAVADGYHVNVSRIVHSGKKRARQTAEILSARLSPQHGVEARRGMNPMDDVHAFAKHLDMSRDLMLVGHLPFLERLTGLLVCSRPEQIVFKMQNSGIVCLDRLPEIDHAVIRWALMPSIG